jgi:UDP-N-acetylglucosamine--N-acetylmuramyl-(pentapeptide) pyrophosphoryl-undecaprenol N-acetylglucosamine transferase
MTVKNLGRNIRALWLLANSQHRAGRILREFSPDVVVGTGGYVSGPVLYKAQRMGIKTLTHEQNAFPGVTTKLLAPRADKILLAVDSARKYLREADQGKITVTGNPVRPGVFDEDREMARRRLGVGDKICVLSFGGSLGARRINEAVAGVMAWHRGKSDIHHIHATGSFDYRDFLEMLKEGGVRLEDNLHLDVREYIDNMPVCLAAADLVICRAGAITLSELQAAGRASILIPSPNVAENHQHHNAMELVDRGAAEIREESELSAETLR